MKSFQEKTEIIRGMIAQRMKLSPCPEDLSFTVLQVWPELLIWGFPEGMIFNIIDSCHLEIKKGYDLREAIRIVETGTNEQKHIHPDSNLIELYPSSNLIEYIKYRLLKEYPKYSYLYNDSLLISLKAFVEKEMGIRVPDSQPISAKSEILPTPISKIEENNKQLNTYSQKGKIHPSKSIIFLVSVILVPICIFCIILYSNSDKRAFQKLKDSMYSYKYENFIQKYPQSIYVEQAYDNLLRIAKKEGIQSLQEFVHKYGEYNGKWYKRNSSCPRHVESALLTIRDSCMLYYQEALHINTLDGWLAYSKKVPDAFRHKCTDSIIEQKHWEKALLLNTEEGYNEYIRQYQLCEEKYRKKAEKKKIDLWVSSFFNPQKEKKYEPHPQIYKVNSYNEDKSTIVITNATKYYLKIGFSGKDNQIITLAPLEDGKVSLPNGNYRIVAANIDNNQLFSSTNVTDILEYKIFVGTTNLSGGLYKVKYYPYIPKPKPNPEIDLSRLRRNLLGTYLY